MHVYGSHVGWFKSSDERVCLDSVHLEAWDSFRQGTVLTVSGCWMWEDVVSCGEKNGWGKVFNSFHSFVQHVLLDRGILGFMAEAVAAIRASAVISKPGMNDASILCQELSYTHMQGFSCVYQTSWSFHTFTSSLWHSFIRNLHRTPIN